MNENSCVGCKFLYTEGDGYSNYTWLDDQVKCAKHQNPNLPDSEPEDWNPENDNWPKTNTSRCELYSSGKMVRLDVDGEDGPADHTDDQEEINAICEDTKRKPHGGFSD